MKAHEMQESCTLFSRDSRVLVSGGCDDRLCCAHHIFSHPGLSGRESAALGVALG